MYQVLEIDSGEIKFRGTRYECEQWITGRSYPYAYEIEPMVPGRD